MNFTRCDINQASQERDCSHSLLRARIPPAGADWQARIMSSENDDTAVGARLFQLRQSYGETQGAFAARFHMTANAYNQYERGTRHLTVRNAIRIAEVTGVTMDWLYRGEVSGLPLRFIDLARGRSPE